MPRLSTTPSPLLPDSSIPLSPSSRLPILGSFASLFPSASSIPMPDSSAPSVLGGPLSDVSDFGLSPPRLFPLFPI